MALPYLIAPRQTGKTSALLALRDLLNAGAAGDLHCAYVNVEAAQAQRENVERAIRVIVGQMASRARASGDGFLYEAWPAIFAIFGDGALQEALLRWAEESPKPLVVLIDEIDTLVGDTLISVLRQLRAGYDQRPERYPQSVVLCGVRDVRGSVFNIKAESLRRETSRKRRRRRCWPSTPRRPARRSPRGPSRRCGGRRKVSRGW